MINIKLLYINNDEFDKIKIYFVKFNKTIEK